ncbi:MAG: type II secretion system GspH family protein [Acidobacteriota bacterium]|nr:type II secretion system GspH family protein [Acidobacteriota bacterium]
MKAEKMNSSQENQRGGVMSRFHLASVRQRRAQRGQKGFSLIELLVVVTIIGILAAVAIVNVRYAQRKAREAALKDNLFQMRKAIDNFYADKQHYPAHLDELVPNYIRRIPKDPITDKVDWEEVIDDPLTNGSQDDIPAETDPNAQTQPGVSDVKSSAQGTTLDNVPYNEL